MSREGSLFSGSLGVDGLKAILKPEPKIWVAVVQLFWAFWKSKTVISGSFSDGRCVFKCNHAHVISFLGLLFDNNRK